MYSGSGSSTLPSSVTPYAPLFQVTHVLVVSWSSNSPCISVTVSSSSSSSSQCSISSVGASVGCMWSMGPPRCGIYLHRRHTWVVPFSSMPSSRQSVYELSKQSVIILGGDHRGNSLAFVLYVTSNFELYICTRSPVLNSTGCTLSSKRAFRHAASASAPV